jgi:putative heme iron utilization protein
MKARAAAHAAALLRRSRAAALGTLHDGAPSVTMAPFALVDAPLALVVFVSALASHTKDMQADARVGVLVAQSEAEGAPVHSLERVSIRGVARVLADGDPMHDVGRRAYLARFADMQPLFSLGDFSLFSIEPQAVRVVCGFAQAASITPHALAAALAA